ncbi:MAG: hypothetical protein QY312_00285 [Candidatus Dojkabacteria bacterium]|nr:MAG: hypothetical protein QY312_00285 [Candidatus Dojkabacteria bacterium]
MTELEFSKTIAEKLSLSGYITKTEVDSGYGVADIVGLKINYKRIRKRENYMQVNELESENYFKVLELITENRKKPSSFEDIINYVGLSKGYLKSRIIKQLIKGHFIKEIDKHFYIKVNGWAPLSNNIIAIESKLSDWKRGLVQASRYKTFANRVYLALPSNKIHLVPINELIKSNTGLITLKHGTIQFIHRPLKQKDEIISSKQNYVCEYFWNDMLKVLSNNF